MEHVTVKDLIEGTGGSFLYGDSQMPVRHIVLDSREIGPGDLFVPLKGEKVDSHRFLEDVVKRGAACVLTSEHETLPEYAASYPCAWIRVEDTKAALQAFGRYMRKRLSLPFVGITGSVGKTTTRELIAAALSAKYRVYKTPGNKNSQVGVPITISEISKDDQVGVIELGMSEPGELKVISEIACIDMAVITNIGITHIEYLGSRENIYREKLTIQDGLKDGGLLILNGDDDLLSQMGPVKGSTPVFFGLGENSQFRADHIKPLGLKGTQCTICLPSGDEFTCVIPVAGSHMVSNALAGAAVGYTLGLTPEEIKAGIENYTTIPGRNHLIQTDSLTILDDCYNANPVSTNAALDVLALSEGRKVAVLGDMGELGENELDLHYQVGAYAAGKGIDLVCGIGPMSESLIRGVNDAGTSTKGLWFANKEDFLAAMDDLIKNGDNVLVKASKYMKLPVVIEALKER